MTRWKKYLNLSAKASRPLIARRLFFILATGLLLFIGCQESANKLNREDFADRLSLLCKNKYQSYVTCKSVDDTLWIYLPYTPGRAGQAKTSPGEEGKNLYIAYEITSFNPYKTIDPPELKFIAQKILGEIRQLLLSSPRPYKFFVLVITDISSPENKYEQWYIGYFNDVKKFSVGRDFSGEGYSRLAWSQESVELTQDAAEGKVSRSYRDTKGEHLNYHDITMKEFVEKQIKWRIYKRFTIGYNKIPFDLAADEKRDEIINIVKTVLTAYNFTEFEKFYLRDSSFLKEDKVFNGYLRQDIEKSEAKGIIRKPAF